MLKTEKYSSCFQSHWTCVRNEKYYVAMFRENRFLKRPWLNIDTITELFEMKGCFVK